MDPAMVQLLMGQQQQTQALAATLEALRTSGAEQTRLLREELAAVRRELADDDEEESTLSNVAKAAAPAFRSGKPAGEQIKAAALNFLFENPTAILDILKPIVAPIAQAVVASMAKAPAPEPAQQVIAAPALVEAKPRPVAVARPKAAAPSSGINELFAKADGPKLDAQQIRANAEAEVERARVAAAEVVEVVNGAASAE
jgi:hypothetical protein